MDQGLLSPVTVGHDALVSDNAVLVALVRAELGLVRAWAALGAEAGAEAEAATDAEAEAATDAEAGAEAEAATDAEAVEGADAETATDARAAEGADADADAGAEVEAVPADSIAVAWSCAGEAGDAAGIGQALGIDAAGLAAAAVQGGNPVIPLVGVLKRALPADDRRWVHRGATSQDILDTALMLVARRAVDAVLADLAETEAALAAFAREHRDVVAAARTLAQHAVPTTVGLRAAGWLGGIHRARTRLQELTLPVQLGGAAGTRASFLELGGPGAARLPALYAEALGLDDIGLVWHTSRWPVTELADALTRATDALGTMAGDVITLSRTEIAELSTGAGGGSSAMPQKSNPVTAVLIRSAALRAPQLAATLHQCAALADDERPAGSWHAEWPTLRELLRLALGASAHAARLAAALGVDRDAVARTLALTRGLILAERLSIVLTPLIGTERLTALVAAAGEGADLAALVAALPEARALDVPALLDPAGYVGDARAAVDRATDSDRAIDTDPATDTRQPTGETQP